MIHMPELINYRRYVSQDLRIAVIGFGKMGILHSTILNLLKPGFVKAIVDKNRYITFFASKLIKDVKFYQDIDKMLSKEEPNICYVTTPVSSHYAIVSKLFESNVKNIFIEKPPTRNLLELKDLIRHFNKQKVMVGFQKRFAFPFRYAIELLSKHIIGDIKEIYAYIKSGDITEPTNRFDRLGRGCLLDLGIHLVDLLEWLVGLKSVKEAKYEKKHTNVDDYFQAELIANNDARVYMEVTWSDSSYRLPETYIKISGEIGVLRVTGDYIKVEFNNGVNKVLFKPQFYQSIPPVNLADPEFTLENIHFLYSIYEKVEPLTSLINVERTMELVDEMYSKAGIKNG